MSALGGLQAATHFHTQFDGALAFIKLLERPGNLNRQDRGDVLTAAGRAVGNHNESLHIRWSVNGKRDLLRPTEASGLARENHRPLQGVIRKVVDQSSQYLVVRVGEQYPVKSDMRGGGSANVLDEHLDVRTKPITIAPDLCGRAILKFYFEPGTGFRQCDFGCRSSRDRPSLRAFGGFLGQPKLAEDEPKPDAVQNDSSPRGNAVIRFDPAKHLRKRHQPDQSYDRRRADQPAQNALRPRHHRTGIAGVARSDQPLGAFG